ncbi:hypothetical protein FOFC_17432 [Fusarium oxysporum]|nr:hypothetical protein FOFC_17432 [Fusarium oxysporum]
MVTETASPAATANSPAKEQDSSLLKTPRSSVQLRQALEYVPASVTQDSTVRLLFRKIGSQLDRYNFEIEKQNREITILQRENEEHRPKRRKKVIYNPNAEFAKIPAIKKAREQMRRTLQPEITANRVQKLKLEDLYLSFDAFGRKREVRRLSVPFPYRLEQRSATTGEPVPSIRYRQPHKRVINSKSQPSAICRHSAQLTTDGNNEYGLYKYCHISGRHDAALFASESTTTTGIIYYLQQQHRLEEFGYKATGSDPFSIAKRTASLTPYLGSRRVVFDDLKFKDDFTDWVIVLDLTFRQATHQRTNEIFINYVEDIDKILPKSPSTLSSWVKEK